MNSDAYMRAYTRACMCVRVCARAAYVCLYFSARTRKKKFAAAIGAGGGRRMGEKRRERLIISL